MRHVIAVLALLSIMLLMPVAQANVVILDTQLELDRGEEWQAKVYAQRGEVMIDLGNTNGLLNFTIYQNNVSLISIELDSVSEPQSASETFAVNSGELLLVATPLGQLTFINTQISIRLTQPAAESNGLIIAGGILIFLALPFFYILGRNQGIKQL